MPAWHCIFDWGHEFRPHYRLIRGVLGLPPPNLRVQATTATATRSGETLVRRGKYHDGRFSDELVDACRRLVEEWRPEPFPTWVTCIPSLRHPDLVPDFARRLATALDLPFELVLVKTEERPEQKSMNNSAHQARNLDGALAIVDGGMPKGPVLLVDDVKDSGWTFTVAAWLLRSNGSGRVWPLALAEAGPGQ